uniref:Uncharacterized protein n=1 Tax=Panagrolaimus sp. ES5 TaxID=591445 RepID=A0AC34GAG4_9BILA
MVYNKEDLPAAGLNDSWENDELLERIVNEQERLFQRQQGMMEGQWVCLGSGYGQIAPADVQAQYRGTPAFYDATRRVYWDGKTVFFHVRSVPPSA